MTVLVDGLGHDLLVRRAGHAPWLRAHLATTRRVASGFPSTTATSMGTFGTGLAAGAHGLLGYEVLVPGADRLLNELSWEDGPDPRTWQPHADGLRGGGRGRRRGGAGRARPTSTARA